MSNTINNIENIVDEINKVNAEIKEEALESNYVENNEEGNCYIFVEADYSDIKSEPNKIWFKYEEKIEKLCKSLAYNKNFDYEDLYQQSYIYFLQLSEKYDPYYNGNFYPFDRFLFKNLIIKLRAYIQDYYYKNNREKPSDIYDYKNYMVDEDLDRLYIDYIYSLLPPKQQRILYLTEVEGYSQQEVGEIIGVSQSRISVIKKNIIKTLKDKIEKDEKEMGKSK